MDYIEIVNLKKEPFSNSPDPEFFFQSRQHLACLQKLELSVRLRRGLNVVIGDVGTGKTTLCRQIIRRFAAEDATETHLILDPNFSSPHEFLNTFAEMLGAGKPASNANEWQVKEIIKQHLFRKGVDEEKKVVLIIDEGQKIPLFCLEILSQGNHNGFPAYGFYIRTNIALSYVGKNFKVYVVVKRRILCMDFKNFESALPVRRPDIYQPVKTARTQNCRVQKVRAVCCGNDYHVFEGFKPIHFRQELVKYPL